MLICLLRVFHTDNFVAYSRLNSNNNLYLLTSCNQWPTNNVVDEKT